MMAESSNEYSTTIGSDAVFKGELKFEKGVRLLGKFEGEISSEGQLVVAEGAALNGNVKAGTVRIDGHVKGNLNANTKVQLTASARLEGDVQTARLEVAEGAVLVGRCTVGVDAQGKAGLGKPATAPAVSVAPTKPKSAEPMAVVGKK
ncbi:MAG: polymer-forming cytoskeletal protein [Phycisphaerae bacterium]